MAKPSQSEHPTAGAACGCASGAERGARKAVAVDPEIRAANLNRLRRIEGQVRGLQRMVEESRYCADILVQLSAVNEALRNVGRELLRNHLRNCATAAIKGSPERAEAMYDELVELFSRYSR
ncbi:MAG: metal-sensitive transcriptional regulator [Acidobacteriia bacterium]|nr:metal-sensitive transcriptional regulator [Terriglobia bacterium]